MKRTAWLMAALLALPGAAFAAEKHRVEVALAEAHSAVEAAVRAGAPEHATNDFNLAQDDMARPERAFDARDWTHATMDAEKAKADAVLAAARTRQDRAETATAEVEATVHRLREELGMPGDKP
jgi:hypothetical protein